MMARRIQRVEKNLQRIIGQIIDEELNPPGLVSVMDVTCDSGLTQARVAVSVYTKTDDVNPAVDYLAAHVGFIRHELSIRAKMRRTPKIRFILDTSLEDGQSMIDYIADLTDSR
ncbi:MAG: 30S ribosome-binding factor RbfA [Chloroflexi bacterium]|nr:30S ribosome-binding factor RbfA [Chloroflexota bacterium]MYK61957.1 30S ribosome-binding factor RbfA [Chloroflexota bacterium]